MEGGSRKLHVADTLAKATRALEAHRSWMKKRAAAVAPIDDVDKTDTFYSSNEYSTVNISSGKSIGRSTTEKSNGSTNPLLKESGAPPPFVGQQFGLSAKENVLMPGRSHTSKSGKGSVETKLRSQGKQSQVDFNTSPLSMKGSLKRDNEAELPPFTPNHNAWGSQSSLNGCGDKPTNSMEQNESSDRNSTLKEGTKNNQHEVMKLPDSPLNQKRETHTVRCNGTASSQMRENLFESLQINELQSNTSATLIPVSPAPMNQRSSFTEHMQSKLMAAEDNVELLDVDIATRRRVNNNDIIPTYMYEDCVTDDYQVVPEAILHSVLPKHNQRNTTFPPMVLSSDLSTDLNTRELNGTGSHAQSIDVLPPMPSVSNSPHLAGDEANHDKHGLEQISISSSSTHSEETHHQDDAASMPKVLDLPPLKKVLIDGNKMVKELPQLRNLQSPLLSPLLTEPLLSQKRNRSPPAYSIHQSQVGPVLAPPCPMYGAAELSVLNSRSVACDETDVFEDSVVPANSSLVISPLVESSNADENACSNETHGNAFTPSNISNPSHSLASDVNGEMSISVSKGDDLCTENNDIIVSQLPPGPGSLHLAAKSGNLRLVHSLLYQGHDVDLPDHEGRSPLMYCIHAQGVHLSCADALIREGANVNKQTSDGSTAIHLASSVGAVSLIELMLLNGANPDIRDFEGRLPIHWATIQKGNKTISLLLKHSNCGVDVTDDAGMTPLMWAAYNNNTMLTSYLLENGADCEEKDIDGYTAMHWAVHRGSTRCLQLLLQPDRTYFKDHKGRTVCHLAAEKGAIEACELILKMRENAFCDTDKTGRTPLHYAAACSRVDVCALLLDRGCDASQKDLTGKSPLDYARIKKLDYVVALLTCHGSAVADFARASRNTSVNTFLNRSVSFTELSHTRSSLYSDEDNTTSLLSQSLNTLSILKKRLVEESKETDIGSDKTDDDLTTEDSGVDLTKGGYLGRFYINSSDPVQHFYFWLKPSNGTLCWCRYRESASNSRSEASILEIHEGASNGVKQNPSYSPEDLHKFVFWVMTGSGVLDLFAYNQDAYTRWVNDIRDIAKKNALVSDQELFERNTNLSQDNSRPASRRSNVSRTSVAPAPLDVQSHESRISPVTSIVTPTALKPKQTDMDVQPPLQSASYQNLKEDNMVEISSTQKFSRRRGISMKPTFTSTPQQSGANSNSKWSGILGKSKTTNLSADDNIPVMLAALEESDVI